MANNKRDIIIPSQGGMIRDLILRVKLILRLVGDRRVSPWLKIIPVAGLVYVLSPLDIVTDIVPVLGQLDDAAIFALTNYLFIELCPPEVVNEHVRALGASLRHADDEEVIDAESVEIKEHRR